jgi:hypothetical protein
MHLPLDGGCACGDLRYRLAAPPLVVHCCHCTRCQRETGSAFAVNAIVEPAALDHLAGSLSRVALPTASGNPQAVSRCASCGTAVWSEYGRRAPLRAVRAGTLDDPARAVPDIHIFTGTKLPWVILPPGVPAVKEYYRRSEHWSEASLERYRLALETATARMEP